MISNIPLYYFTASGNTRYCAELVQKGFKDKEITVDLVEIKKVSNLPFPRKNSDYPAIGLAFPVYEFMVPRIILTWLKNLPPAQQSMPVFIIDTSGGFPCDSAGVAMRLLKAKNYEPIGVLEVPTPTSEPFFNNKFYPVGWSREILDQCYSFGVLIANRLHEESDKFVDLRLSYFQFPWMTRLIYDYISKGGTSSGGIIKFQLKKCIQCGACEKVCPMEAINIKNVENPINIKRCMACATCVRACSSHALSISYRPKRVPPSKRIGPKLRPGYREPDNYQAKKGVHLKNNIFSFLLGMMRKKPN